VKCVGCGAESADVAQTCAGCGAPVAGPRSAPAQAALEPATPVPAAVRWLLLACLLLFLILFTIGQVGAVNTTQESRLQGLMIGISWLAVFGAQAFLILFEGAALALRLASLGCRCRPAPAARHGHGPLRRLAAGHRPPSLEPDPHRLRLAPPSRRRFCGGTRLAREGLMAICDVIAERLMQCGT
jgi:hypothetical protein